MSLLEELLAGPGPQERYSQLQQLQALSGGGGPSTPGASFSTTPPGRGIFGNDSVDVLQAGDPRLRNVGGTQLARPAARSMIEVLRSLGIPVQNIGGGYRTAEQQAGMNPALAAPVGQSYHQEGLAIDLAATLQNARVERALEAAGWNRFSPSGEPWHWSYGVTG